ncbi:MAG TPA: SprT family zinc-dependent metalloprotease [Verrucomicrobiae bacterium]|nr:SprT family zinc-dependent metalloprotease [Verrucomicrobiae bacterium]
MNDSIEIINIGKRRVQYRVRRSRTAQRMRIKVSTAGVEVVTPAGAEADRADQFVRQNSRWVLTQLDFIKRASNLRVKPARTGPESILFHGSATRVEFVQEDTNRRHALVAVVNRRIVVRVPSRHVVDVNKAVEAWLRRQAKAEIAQRLRIHAKEMRQQPGHVYIMGQRTKWGGCSRRRNLSFNWRLIMAPPEVLDYIVVHELAHLAEPYHSTKFWLIVRSYCPAYDRYRRWLRGSERRLMDGLHPARDAGLPSGETGVKQEMGS